MFKSILLHNIAALYYLAVGTEELFYNRHEIKHSFSSSFENSSIRGQCTPTAHSGAGDTGEHSTSVPYTWYIAPCKTAEGKVPGMSYKEL